MIHLRELKAGFFDTEKVARQIDAATRRALSKFGAFVRQRAKTSIRKRKAVSQPGEPPSSHAGDLRNKILFAYDADRKGVVIGPVKFRKGEAPRLLERGGAVTRTNKKGETRTLRYRGNPFMKPAGDAELPKFGDYFRSMLR